MSDISRSKTTLMLFHDAPARSRANAALLKAAATVEGVDCVDMQAVCGGGIDGDQEVARLIASRRIVLQFPLQWYATPPLLKTWQDQVLTRMFYLAYETEGRKLEGTPLMLAVTAGNDEAAYRAGGANLFALEDLLRPLEATAHRCGLIWTRPFVLYRANRLDDAALAEAGQRYAARPTRFCAGEEKRLYAA